MKNFTYYRPTSAEQAVGMLDAKWGTTEMLAGGTDLLDLQKEYIAQPDKVVSLTGIGSLTDLDMERDGGAGSVTIGAGITLAALADNTDLQKLFPALTEAAGQIGGRRACPSSGPRSATAAGISATSIPTACSKAVTSALPSTAKTNTTPSSPRRIRA